MRVAMFQKIEPFTTNAGKGNHPGSVRDRDAQSTRRARGRQPTVFAGKLNTTLGNTRQHRQQRGARL